MDVAAIRVKFVGRGGIDESSLLWSRQIANGRSIDEFEFIFDRHARSYDWFVVYDDLPRCGNDRRDYHVEELRCRPDHTLLITSEPSSVRRYPRLFLDQFNFVLSSQEPQVLQHSGQILAQCGLRWYYGIGGERLITLDQMIAHPPIQKSAAISTITSSKKHRHTLHASRVKFIEQLNELVPELDRFGHGVRLIGDKAEALDPYRYHIAVENHIAPHHWTEKLSDAFLACTLPFYIGAPNVFEYFPKESLIQLSLDDAKGSARIVAEAIANREWENRFPAIMKARQLVIERYGLFQNIATVIRQLSTSIQPVHHSNGLCRIESARDARMRRPVYSFLERISNAKRFMA